MSTSEFQEWHASDPKNAHDYATSVGVDPVALGCLPDGFTSESFEQFRAQNPFMAARWASDHRIYERGYKATPRAAVPVPTPAPVSRPATDPAALAAQLDKTNPFIAARFRLANNVFGTKP
jgi:hypothetical protein